MTTNKNINKHRSQKMKLCQNCDRQAALELRMGVFPSVRKKVRAHIFTMRKSMPRTFRPITLIHPKNCISSQEFTAINSEQNYTSSDESIKLISILAILIDHIYRLFSS